MYATLTTKPTTHKNNCMLCGKPMKKYDKVIRVSQCMYPGERVGYICKRHLKGCD